VLYLAAYVAADIFVATAVLIAAMLAQLAYAWLTTGRIGRMVWANFAAAAVFGGLTLAWSDPRYLVARATVIYWVIGAALVLAHRLAGRNLLQLALQPYVDAPEAVWRRELYACAAFFGVLGFGNIALAYSVSEALWVAFDTLGALVLIALFLALQVMRMRKHERRLEDRG
jgi:intracellular septation protein